MSPVWAMPVTGSSGQNKALSLYVCDARQAGPVRRKGAYHGPRADERQTARPQPGHDGDLSGTDSRCRTGHCPHGEIPVTGGRDTPGGLNRGLLEYGKFPAHTFFGELYTDREYTQFFLFPFERVPGEDDGTSTYVAGSSVYVAPAASLDEAKALLESYGLMESHGLPIPDESPQ